MNSVVFSVDHSERLYPSKGPETLPLHPALKAIGVIHEKWTLSPVNEGEIKFTSDTFLNQLFAKNYTCISRIQKFVGSEGSMDILNLSIETEGLDQHLENFKLVHDHAAAEIRLILDGEGIFYIYENGNQHEILVTRGSFLFLPKEIAHNFTLTDKIDLVALRIFQDQDGWIERPCKS